MAALFNPRFFSQPEPNFRGLFRLLEDFDQYSAQNDGRDSSGNNGGSSAHQFFTPKFDLKETETAYELHGELPGIDKQNVSIEFTDPQTVVIRGKVERSYTRGTPPAAGAIEANSSNKSQGAITESGEGATTSTHQTAMPHKVTVEDENEGTSSKTTTDAPAQQPSDATAASTSTEVAKTSAAAGTEIQKQQQQRSSAPAAKYWVSERSIGQFSRTFHFPTRVDNDATTADLANGILTVTVPKAKKLDGKRITIN